jgi:DnaJ domain
MPEATPAEPGALSRDPYEVLQVSPGASDEVIRAAYRVLARRYHPDVNQSPTAARRMGDLNSAYAALTDPARRAELDAKQQRTARVRTSRPAHPPRRPLAPIAQYHTAPRRPILIVGTVMFAIAVCVVAVTLIVVTVNLVADAIDGVDPTPWQISRVQSSNDLFGGPPPAQPVLNYR